jgi:hypothetical protein
MGENDGLLIVLGLFGVGYLMQSGSKLIGESRRFIEETEEHVHAITTGVTSTSGLLSGRFVSLKYGVEPASPLGILQSFKRWLYG